MPGYVERFTYPRCPECDGPDIGNVGFFMHLPWCSTQPDHEQALKRKAEYEAERRAFIDELTASPEAKRLRELRTTTRLS